MDDSIEAVEAVRAVAEGNQQFSRAVWAAVGEKEGGNLAVSPYSLSAVMAMLAEGASGPTLEQIQAGLSFPTAASRQAGYRETIPALRTNDNFTLESASQVFVMENFKLLPEFVQNLHQNYHAGVQTVNFAESVAASKTINNWVADLTRDKIDNLVSEDMLNSMTRCETSYLYNFYTQLSKHLILCLGWFSPTRFTSKVTGRPSSMRKEPRPLSFTTRMGRWRWR